MANIILHHEGQFLIYSTSVDAPITFGMSEEELVEYYREEYGQRGVEELAPRIDRAKRFGTSKMGIGPASLAGTILCNRAGPNGRRLSERNFIQTYFIDKTDPEDSPQ